MVECILIACTLMFKNLVKNINCLNDKLYLSDSFESAFVGYHDKFIF